MRVRASGTRKSVVRRIPGVLTANERGQVTLLGLLFLLVIVLLAIVLVDVIALLEARNWGYQVAQQAALTAASTGRAWGGATVEPGGECLGPGPVELNANTAYNTAINVLAEEMALRGLTTYAYDVRVLPAYNGGAIAGFPPEAVRLGSGRGSWTSDEPAVGVYLTFPLSTFLMSFVGRPTVDIQVFASASVAQPSGVCPPP